MKASIAIAVNAILMMISNCPSATFAQGTSELKDAAPAALEPGEPLLLPAWLRQLNGTVTFTAESVDIEELELADVRLALSSSGERIELTDGRATSGPGDLVFDGYYEFANNDARLSVTGQSLSFDDDELRTPGALIFDHEDLLPDWLQAVDGRLTLDVDLVIVDEMQLRGVKGPIVFTDRGFDAELVSSIGDGSVLMNINHRYAGMTTSIKAQADNVSMGVMRSTRNYVEGVPTKFEINLVGEGDTERAFVSSMDGYIEAELGAGTIINTEIDKLAQNAFALTFSSILPLKTPQTRVKLECGALRLDFIDGRAQTEHGVVLRSDKLVIIGRGDVDLNQETIDVHFKPHVRQGIKTKTGGAVSLISLSGHMDAPKLKVKTGGLLTEGLSLGAAWATFGLSKAAEAVFDWRTSADIACEIAVEK